MPNHRLVRTALAAACFSPALLASCEPTKNVALRQYISGEIAQLKDADPKADLDAALAKGDYRFIALHGVGPMIPAVEDFDVEVVVKRYGLHFIENTSNAPRDEQEKDLNTAAWGYAEKYNSMLRKIVHLEH